MHNRNTYTRQPLGFSGILGTTISLYRKHFFLFLGIIALHFCGELAEYVLGRFLPDFFLKDSLIDFIDMLFALVSLCGIIVAVATVYFGGHITSIKALKQTRHRFWQAFVCGFVWSLAFDISSTGIVLTLISVMDPVTAWTPGSAVTDPLLPSSFVLAFLGLAVVPFSICFQPPWWDILARPILSGLLFFSGNPGLLWMQFIPLAVVPFSIYFAVLWTFATPVVLLGKPSIRGAFKKSSELARSRWWNIWTVFICFSLLVFVMGHIVRIGSGSLLILTKLGRTINGVDLVRLVAMYPLVDGSDLLFYAIIGWTASIATTLIFPLWGIGITLLYFDCRIRKEGFDAEMR